MDEVLLGKREARRWGLFLEELKKVSSVAVPFMAVAVSQYLLQAVSVMMAGHLGQLSLSAVAIATSFCNVTGFSLLSGFAGAMETLCGQAYGAKQYQKFGSYTYCAIMCLIPICLPVCLLWVFMDKLLVLTGQDPEIAKMAWRYGIWLIPALFPYSILQSQVRYFQTQSLILPMLFVSLATLCFHVPVCWVLVFKSGLENTGAALSIGLSYWLNVILLGFHMRYSASCEKTRCFILKDVFSSVKHFFRFGIPSAVMLCLEWWSFEILILLSGLLPDAELQTSVISICFTSSSLHYYIPFGISVAASTRVSNELGGGNPEAAQISTIVVTLVTLAEAVIASVILFCCRHIFGYAYSDDKEVVNNVAKMVPLMCLSIIMDSLHVVLAGIVRGIGWQHIGAYANLGAYYLVGIPMGVLGAFVLHLRAEGLWLGMVCGSTVQGILLALVSIFTNWKNQAIKARERMLDGTHVHGSF
ncbi:hypothetical protein ERO13_D12G055200v2 [Gossypium hirsutum]|uniref:Protein DETOXIFICATION n=3 Tax=Gossypium TaxID=3633 RepID=A0A1U8KGL7_GOSHI|nr:protein DETOXIFICATION 3-like isoform X1 [Gossypium hirsutum]KAG4114597.1 hypothetical protein ERO13_D12G055200v2 [Gossypium hirsutum]